MPIRLLVKLGGLGVHPHADRVSPSHRGGQLACNGVDYIIQQAEILAGLKGLSLTSKRISPHLVRYTTAMHLLQSGVDISLIALWLGHESIETRLTPTSTPIWRRSSGHSRNWRQRNISMEVMKLPEFMLKTP